MKYKMECNLKLNFNGQIFQLFPLQDLAYKTVETFDI